MRTQIVWTLLAVLAGAGMAVQSRVNGELGLQLDQGMLAALISFSIGLALLGVIALCSPALRRGLGRLVTVIRTGEMPWWYATTGLIGAFFVAAQGLTAGITGVALFTVGVVAGQTISSLAVDRMGLGGLAPKRITAPRLLGAAMALGAVLLAVAGQGGGEGTGASWLLVLPFVAGLLQSLQQAMGGVVQRSSGSALAQATSNFLLGTLALGLVVLVQALAGVEAQPLPANPILYIGGALGVAFIATASVAVHHLGVLTLGLATICGQVLASLLLDVVLPVHAHGVTPAAVGAAALTIAAVAVSAIRTRRRSAA
ncbi:DMT family transporter [Agrococcus sp. SL85]|uniref:DMT family transporter n=1 Tax=Agrococcus sp. SL85 TaxID=2995141 RepID=UPI00226CE448|nr:DMT family transporter [Agrococcus sp. SL85]WAC66543.1 DMT family transporter [Agrococcus sp. SL85]